MNDKKSTRPPSLGALAKRISHPRIQRVDQVLAILETAVSHPNFYTTKVVDEAYDQICDRLVDMTPPQDTHTLHRLSMSVGRLTQKRSFMAIGFPPPVGCLSLVERERARGGELPWTQTYIEKTPGGARVLAALAPESYEYWIRSGRADERSVLRVAMRSMRDIRAVLVTEKTDRVDSDKIARELAVGLARLDGLAQYYHGTPTIWTRLARVARIDSLESWRALEAKTQRSFPALDSGFQRSLLAQNAAPTSHLQDRTIGPRL